MNLETFDHIPFQERQALLDACKSFNIEISKATKCNSPTLCNVYKVKGENSSFAIKIYPSAYSEEELASEIEFIRILWDAGCSVPKYLISSSGRPYFISSSNLKAAAYFWINGQHSTLSLDRVQLVINMLLKCILATQSVRIERNSDWVWEETERYLSEIKIPFDITAWVFNHALLKCPWHNNGDLVLCHNDISTRNIIWEYETERPFLIDFTNSISAPLEWEFATMTANITLENGFKDNSINFCAIIKESIISKKIKFDWAYYDQLLLIAMAQRAVFITRGQKDQQNMEVWTNLRGWMSDNHD